MKISPPNDMMCKDCLELYDMMKHDLKKWREADEWEYDSFLLDCVESYVVELKRRLGIKS